MSDEIVHLAPRLLALILIGAAAWAGFGALRARSLISAVMHTAAASACISAALVLRGAGDAALAAALLGVGWAPIVLMAGVSLSTRVVKQGGRGRWLPSAVAAAGAAGAMLWAGREVLSVTAARAAATAPISVWLAAALFASGAAAFGLLAFGERGMIGREAGRSE